MRGGRYIYTLVILYQLALVALGTGFVQNFEQLQDEFGSEDLIFITKRPIHNNKTYGGPTTILPNVGITTQEPVVTDLGFEEEWLLPGFAAEEDLLRNRDKRAVEGSGSDAPELNACLGVDSTQALPATTSPTFAEFKTATETAILDTCKVKSTTLSSVEVLNFDVEKSIINFKFVFPSTTDISNTAQCLRDMQTQGSITIGAQTFQISKDPLIENGANQLVAAICELCTAQQFCILNVASLYFCGTTELYSTSQTDTKLPQTEDSTGTLTTETTIPIGSTLYNEFYISSNGFLSLVDNAGPQSIKLDDVTFDIMAVAWADSNVLLNGDVFYQAHTITDSISPETQAVLTRASSDVKNYAPKSSFEATTVIVVTWKEVAKLFGTAEQHATFQLVLASDGFESYALYIYGDNSWANTDDVVIGFRNSQGLTTNPFSKSSLITGLKSMKGNSASNGIWIYKVGEVTSNSLEKCKVFHSKEASQKNVYQTKNEEVPDCPCSKAFLNEKYVEEINDANRECYVINTLGQHSTYSRLCCYVLSSNQFIESDPYSGSLLKYNPLTNRQQYLDEDFNPWNDCCIEESKCNLFRQVRPTKDCLAVANEALVFGFGDPHITTADGFSYTFNGLGEFTFLKIGTFTIQMRAVKATDAQGNKLDATVFGAFAISDGSSSGSLQVELSTSFDQLVLYVNKKDVSLEFYDNPEYLFVLPNALSLKRSGTNSADIINANGVTLRVEVALRMLNVGFSIPKTFKKADGAAAQVSGLIGNFDGVDSNDITTKDGTILPNTATDKEIYEAGKTWAVTEQESLFIYQNGLTHDDYNDLSFTPIFASDFTPQELSDAANVCGGTDKTFCIYDYTITKDTSIATSTKDLNLNSQNEITALKNEIPQISTDKPQLVATVGELATLTVTTSDGNGDVVSVSVNKQPDTDFNYDAPSGIATWTPANNDVVSIEFQAADDKNAQSPLLIIDITLCPSCNNKGTCHASEIRNSPVNNYFRIRKCVCVNGLEGEDCETEIDGCLYKPCDPLQTCTDKVGELSDGDAGYTCSDCPAGYNTVGLKCQDKNECDDSTICGTGGICNNVPGSYTCTCNSGYRVVNQKCEDIDECLDRTNNCDQKCENTVGGFTCSCEAGFDKVGDNNCQANTSPCGRTDCKYGCKIKSEDNSETCFCPSSQELQLDGITCRDVDECTLGICQQLCTNKDTGFTCSCQDGFKLAADGLSCEACTELKWGTECSQTCDCNGRGSCDSVRGCQCTSMWTGEDCNTDVDECTVNPNICPAGLLCRNLPGSHECYCLDGYDKVGNECQDVNECTKTMGICTGDNEICVNNIGSYTCDCAAGFIRNTNTKICDDVNECTSGIHGCEQLCANNEGSFNCLCQLGFRIKNDRKTCENDPTRNPCEDFGSANCQYGCKVENNQPVCFCQKGYILGTDEKSCIDVNECDGNHGCSDSCVNTPGDFECKCEDYKKLQNDGKTCRACLSSEWGKQCENTCDCSAVGSQGCVNEIGCQCKPGWTGVKCDQDQDECSITGTCTITGSVCVNTPGSYQCNCKDGFTLSDDKQTCEDIDECSKIPKVCEQTCTNNEGSYSCSCENGFILNTATNKCEDIDECDIGKDDCEQKCRNTLGSFVCECNDGFTINSDRKTCSAQTACGENSCKQTCAFVGGNNVCGCNKGYTLNNADNTNCDVIPPCEPNPCNNGTCNAATTTYTCSCDPGTKLKNDDVTCEECVEGKYGADCAQTCSCVSSNTASCNKVDGTCTCNSGWNGATCSNDVNECTDSTICSSVPNSQCENIPGSYNCKCNNGYVKVNGKCEECTEGKFGENCAQTCSCVSSNTASCNKVDGTCTCNSGWNGATCSNDVNECSDSTICSSVPNSQCEDSVGSYNCKCNAGYTKVNGKCEDVNECLSLGLNTCNFLIQDCSNTVGSFQCNCKQGYSKDGDTCKDVNECSSNSLNTCNDQTEDCSNIVGSFQCNCKQGYSKDGDTCKDVNECASDSLNTCNDQTEDCSNTAGSFQCKCKLGYFKNGNLCKDVDECVVNNGGCEINCTNTDSSFYCSCPTGQQLDARDSKSCYAKADESKVKYQIRFDINNKGNVVNNSTSSEHAKLKEQIGDAVLKYILSTSDSGVVNVIVTKLSPGSIIADMDVIALQFQSLNASVLSKQFYDLLQGEELVIDGTSTKVLGITTDGTTLTSSNSKCEILKEVKPCESKTEICEEQNDKPVCRPVSETSNQDLAMVVGLSVGIPLGVLIIAGLTCCIYFCVKRNKNPNGGSDRATHIEPRDPFVSVFSGQVPKRGGWAANRYGLYSPDTLSAGSQASSDSDGKLITRKQKPSRMDFNDSAWNDNRSFSYPSGTQDGTQGNFSWEHMFRALEPMRNFEIQRPNYQATPVYPIRGRRPDSMA